MDRLNIKGLTLVIMALIFSVSCTKGKFQANSLGTTKEEREAKKKADEAAKSPEANVAKEESPSNETSITLDETLAESITEVEEKLLNYLTIDAKSEEELNSAAAEVIAYLLGDIEIAEDALLDAKIFAVELFETGKLTEEMIERLILLDDVRLTYMAEQDEFHNKVDLGIEAATFVVLSGGFGLIGYNAKAIKDKTASLYHKIRTSNLVQNIIGKILRAEARSAKMFGTISKNKSLMVIDSAKAAQIKAAQSTSILDEARIILKTRLQAMATRKTSESIIQAVGKKQLKDGLKIMFKTAQQKGVRNLSPKAKFKMPEITTKVDNELLQMLKKDKNLWSQNTPPGIRIFSTQKGDRAIVEVNVLSGANKEPLPVLFQINKVGQDKANANNLVLRSLKELHKSKENDFVLILSKGSFIKTNIATRRAKIAEEKAEYIVRVHAKQSKRNIGMNILGAELGAGIGFLSAHSFYTLFGTKKQSYFKSVYDNPYLEDEDVFKTLSLEN